jgi:hypothetical protein
VDDYIWLHPYELGVNSKIPDGYRNTYVNFTRLDSATVGLGFVTFLGSNTSTHMTYRDDQDTPMENPSAMEERIRNGNN